MNPNPARQPDTNPTSTASRKLTAQIALVTGATGGIGERHWSAGCSQKARQWSRRAGVRTSRGSRDSTKTTKPGSAASSRRLKLTLISPDGGLVNRRSDQLSTLSDSNASTCGHARWKFSACCLLRNPRWASLTRVCPERGSKLSPTSVLTGSSESAPRVVIE